MSPTDRHTCPDCGAPHPRRQPKKQRVSTAANTDLKPARCTTCRRPVMKGRIDGLDYTLEAQPINQIGLLTYRGVRRPTFTRRGTRARATTYATRWPPPERASIHVVHDCALPVPEPLCGDTVTHSARQAAFEIDPDNPPY